MIEEDLLFDLHYEWCKALAQQVIQEMQRLQPGGLFEGVADCLTLWDEACWALQETDDIEAQEAAYSCFRQFAWPLMAEIAPAEHRIHAWCLSTGVEDGDFPTRDEAALVQAIADAVSYEAGDRDLDELVLRTFDDIDAEDED